MISITKYFSINPDDIAINYKGFIRIVHMLLLIVGTFFPVLGMLNTRGEDGVQGLLIFVFLAAVPISYLICKLVLNFFFGFVYVVLNIEDNSRISAKELQFIRSKRFPSE